MAQQRQGSDEDRQQSTIYLANCLWKGKDREPKKQEVVEGLLGLKAGFLPDHMYARRSNRGRGSLKVRGLSEVDYVIKSQLGYDKDRLDDQFVFELGLRQLLNKGLSPLGITHMLDRRRSAQKAFEAGLARMRKGNLPETRPGQPKKWTRSTPEEARAALEAWIDEIGAYGCYVMDAEQWLDWFKCADSTETMEEFLQNWSHSWSSGETPYPPCPPIYGLDLDLWEHHEMLNSSQFLDRLILVTESDMPYSIYHARFEQPKRNSSLCGHEGAVKCVDADGWEVEWHGDDIGAWVVDRSARMARSKAEATALIDRASWRKSGGVN